MLEPHRLAAREHARIAHGIGWCAHLRRRNAVPLEQRDELGRRAAARERLDLAVDGVHVGDSRVARREARIALELGARHGREHAARELVRRRADGEMAVGRFVDAERREPRHHASRALRHAARFEQVEGSAATSDVSTPSIETSTCRPRPVTSRCRSAARMPTTREDRRERSANGTPTRTGGSSGAPDVIISPLSAWMMLSMALPEPVVE